MSDSASASLRGFRKQTIYILYRILTEDDDNIIFHPESAEDLAAYRSGQLVEAIQVKDYSSTLSFSDLTTFFRRLQQRRKKHPQSVTKIASFGAIGPELHGAMNPAADAHFRHRKKISEKLDLLVPGVQEKEWIQLLEELGNQIEHPVLSHLEETIIGELSGTIVAADRGTSLELLTSWVLDASEHKRAITRDGLILQLTKIGTYLAALRDQSSEWLTNIVPVENEALSEEQKERLVTQYRQGVQAQWKHILADADYPRRSLLEEIHRKIARSGVVIVRGASGQGKSSLGWRYLRDYGVEGLRFHVRGIRDSDHAYQVANVLTGHIKNLRLPALVYFDVSPQNGDWTGLAREFALEGIKLLVTVRQEDFPRETLSLGDFDYAEVNVDHVTADEAKPIFEELSSLHPGKNLDFEDAWTKFGKDDGGPLLEFTHIVTEGESLAHKIAKQVRRLQNLAISQEEGLSPAHIDLLSLGAIANQFGACVSLSLLCQDVGLPINLGPLEILEREYLIRSIDERAETVVAPLHSLRSKAIVAALFKDSPDEWLNFAKRALKLILDEDLELFLLAVFAENSEAYNFLKDEIHGLALRSWRQAGGICNALIWQGLSCYETANQSVILQSIAKVDAAWSLLMDSLVGMGEQESKPLLNNMTTLAGMEKLPYQLSPKIDVFSYFSDWISVAVVPPSPEHPMDWKSVGDICFWLGRLDLGGSIRIAAERLLPQSFPKEVTVETIGHFISGRTALGGEEFDSWTNDQSASLRDRFTTETNSLSVCEEGEEIEVSFSISASALAPDTERETDWNLQAMERITLIRNLFPDREVYSSRGFGLVCLGEILPADPTLKQIPVSNLPAERSTSLNSRFQNLVAYRHLRPESWAKYATKVFDFRESALNCCSVLVSILDKMVASSSPAQVWTDHAPGESIVQLQMAGRLPMFPRSAVDPWGYISEDKTVSRKENGSKKRTMQAEALQRFSPWRKSLRKYSTGLGNFVNQLPNAMSILVNARECSAPVSGEDVQTCRLVLINLSDAIEAHEEFTRNFDRHFGKYFDSHNLVEASKSEVQVLKEIWNLFFAFFHNPLRLYKRANHLIESRLAQNEKAFLKALKRKTSAIWDNANVTIEIATSEDPQSPNLLLVCNFQDPAEFNQIHPKLVLAIHQATRFKSWKDLEWLPLQISWTDITIVKLFRGKALRPEWVSIPLGSFFQSGQYFDAQFHHLKPVPVNPSKFARCGFSAWEHPLLTNVSETAAKLYELVMTFSRTFEIIQYDLNHDLCEADQRRFREDLGQDFEQATLAALDSLEALEELVNRFYPGGRETWLNSIQEARTHITAQWDQDLPLEQMLSEMEVWYMNCLASVGKIGAIGGALIGKLAP